MITKKQKKELIKELAEKVARQKAVVFFDYTGLQVNEFQKLRSELKKNEVDCQVIKKTLMGLALEKAGFKGIDIKRLSGQIALAFGAQDEVSPAKIIYGFAKKNENVKMAAGLVQGEYLDGAAIVALAKLPSKAELLGKAVSSISSPLYGLVGVLQGNLTKLVYILSNLKPAARV